VSYLSWLRASRHEFQALVKRALGEAAAESIDLRHRRVVCIATDFTRHDRFAVHLMGHRIDLVRYRLFDDGLLSLLLVESAPGSSESGRGVVRQESADRGLSSACGGGPKPVQAILEEAPESLRDLYGELHKSLTSSGDVEAEAKLRQPIRTEGGWTRASCGGPWSRYRCRRRPSASRFWPRTPQPRKPAREAMRRLRGVEGRCPPRIGELRRLAPA
jgi:hypothetical protein